MLKLEWFIFFIRVLSGVQSKDDIQAIIRMDKEHPTPSPGVKIKFEAHMINVKKSIESYSAAAVPMMQKYAAFMKEQDCQPICPNGEFVFHLKSSKRDAKFRIINEKCESLSSLLVIQADSLARKVCIIVVEEISSQFIILSLHSRP